MPTVPQIIRMRQRRRAGARRDPKGRVGLGCSSTLSLVAAALGVLTALAYVSITISLPSVELLPALLDPPDGLLLQPSRLYDRSGEHILLTLEHPAAAGRNYLPLENETTDGGYLPEALIKATLASTDPYFWNHNGAPLASFFPGNPTTLAQRLAANLLLAEEPPGFRRDLRQRLLAAQITSQFGRQKVIEWYLNSANYGRLAYGADAAARLYFGIPAGELDLAQAAMLAATGLNPELNPMDAPQAALEQQKRVIQELLRTRMITPDEGLQATNQQLGFRDPERQGQALSIQELAPELAPAFIRLALAQLETQISRSKLEQGGLSIITTLNYQLQQQASCSTAVQLARLQDQADEKIQPADCQAARLLPTLSGGEAYALTGLAGNAVVLDPASGQILALVGDPPASVEGPALDSQPTGSLAAPFIYLTAFTRGLSPASLVWDIPDQEGVSSLENFDGLYHGPMRLRIALANDYLVPAEKVLTQVGAENAWRTAMQLSLVPPGFTDSPGLSSLDLIKRVNLVNAVQAFGVLANQGVQAGRSLEDPADRPIPLLRPAQPASALQPVTILSVADANGEQLLDWHTSQTRPILTPQLAYLLTDVLSDETARWPSLGHPNPLEIGRPAAAKLARSLTGDSNWAIGYTPQLVVGAWIGSSAPQQAGAKPTVAEATAGLWHAIIQYANQRLPYQSWSQPQGISQIEVCDPSGLLPSQSCPNTVFEVFLQGSEPLQADTLYQSLELNRQTGRLATVFTPPDLVEKRVFMAPPPEALAWAEQAGIPTIPETYDTIPTDLPFWEDAQIISPQMFDILRSQTPILGVAGGATFTSYRLQVGAGLNPTEWLLIGDDVTQPTSGQLGAWDTNGLDGLYTIQLLVVAEDQSVKRTNLLVTVDNTPPEVRFLSPANNEEIDSSQRPEITIRASAEDEIGIQSVIFYLNGDIIASLTQPPFVISWRTKTGEHSLQLLASDEAGNTSQTTLTFTVK